MLILLNGDTWYGKYGFRPIDINTYEYNDKKIKDFFIITKNKSIAFIYSNEILNEKYNNNKLIINSITIKEANIIKYIIMTKNNNIIDAVKKILINNENMLLKDFLKRFLN